jgi:hypothetical protein
LQTVVDTPRLMVGRSDEAPAEFHRLTSAPRRPYLERGPFRVGPPERCGLRQTRQMSGWVRYASVG